MTDTHTVSPARMFPPSRLDDSPVSAADWRHCADHWRKRADFYIARNQPGIAMELLGVARDCDERADAQESGQ